MVLILTLIIIKMQGWESGGRVLNKVGERDWNLLYVNLTLFLLFFLSLFFFLA